MFEYGGKQYTLEQVEAVAKEYGLSVDAYIENIGMTRLDEDAFKNEMNYKINKVAAEHNKVSLSEKPASNVPVPQALLDNMAAFAGGVKQTKEFQQITPEPEINVDEDDESKKLLEELDLKIKQGEREDRAEFIRIKQPQVTEQLDSLKAFYPTTTTPEGEILNIYNDKALIDNFNNDAVSDFIKKDKDVQNNLTTTFKAKESLIQKDYSKWLKDNGYGADKLEDFAEFTPEQLKDLEDNYNVIVNKHVLQGNDALGKMIEGYEDILGDYHKKASKEITSDKAVKNWLSGLRMETNTNVLANPHAQNFQAIANTHRSQGNSFEFLFKKAYETFPKSFKRAFGGFRRIGSGIDKGGLQVNSPADHIYNLDKLEEQASLFNYDDNTKGFFNKDGRFQIPKEGEFDPRTYGYTEPGTLGEARERLKKEIVKRTSMLEQDFSEVMARLEVDAAFEHADVRDLLESGKRLDYIGNLLLEQGSQIASALVTFGVLPAAQMGGDNYYNQVVSQAKKKFGVVSPSVSQMMEVVNGDVNNEIGESAAGVGFVSGAAEYIGLRTVLGLTGSSLKSVKASLLKGQFKSWLNTAKVLGTNSVVGGFNEFLTETFQQFANDLTTGEYDKEMYIQGGGAGFTMGFVLPGIGGVSKMTATEVQAAYQIMTGKIDIKGLNQFHSYVKSQLQVDLEKGNITQEEYDAKLQLVDDMYTRSEMVSREMDDSQREGLKESIFQREEERKYVENYFNENREGLRIEAEEKKALEQTAKENNVALSREQKQPGPITQKFIEAQIRFNEAVKKTEFIKNYNKQTYDAVKAFAEVDGVSDMVIENTTEEFVIKYLQLKRGIKNPTKAQIRDETQRLQNRPGAFVGENAEGKKQIYINAEAAIATGNTAVVGHEIKHALLYNMMQDFGDQVDANGVPVVSNIIKSLNDYVLKMSEEGKITGIRDKNAETDFVRTMLPYFSYDVSGLTKLFPQLKGVVANKEGFTTLDQITNALPNMSPEAMKNMLLALVDNGKSMLTIGKEDEYLTMLSQGMTQGVISYNADFSEKLSDSFRRMSQIYGKGEIEFNDGRDVFNFVRDYNKSIAKQKATKAQLRFAESRKDNKNNSFRGSLFDGARKAPAKTEQKNQAVDNNEKFSITEKQKELSEQVQKIYDEAYTENASERSKTDAKFKIAEMYRPMFRNIAVRRDYKSLPGFNQDADIIEDESLTNGKYGITYLVEKYDPSKGVPLAAYLNTFYPNHVNRAVQDVLNTDFGFAQDVDELRGGGPKVEAEEAFESLDDAISAVGYSPQGEFSTIRRKMELTPVEMNKVRSVATRALVTAPGITDSKKYQPQVFRKFMQEAYKRLLYKTFLDFVPTRRADFIQWARKNKSWLEKEMTLNTLRKFPAFEGVLFEFVLDENGKKVRYSAEEASQRGIRDKYSGVAKIKRKTPTKQEWDNFLDPTRIGMSKNMPMEHKRVLLEALSIEIGLDATLEVMQNPNQQVFDMEGNPIEGRKMNVFEQMIENNADAMAENQIIGRAAFVLDRDPSVKFSIAGETAGYSDTRMAELIFENPGPLLEAFKASVNPYRLMSVTQGDVYSDRLRSALTQNLLKVFKTDYNWMDERSAAAIAPQLARDFMTIHRQIDSLKMLANKKAEEEFMEAMTTNLYNIAETTTFNKGYKAIIKDAKPLSPVVSEDLMGQVFVSRYPDADKAIVNYILGNSKSPHKDVTDLTVAKATYFGNRDETSASAELNHDIANALVNAKTLYQNNLISRDHVFNLIQNIFEGTQGQEALIDFAAVPSVVMKGVNVNNRVKVHTYPKNYLSASLTNAILNPNIESNTLFRIMDEFATMTVTRPYAELIKQTYGKNMPHFRDGHPPSMLSRIARLKVGKKGSGIMQFYRPALMDVIGKKGEDLVEFSSKFFEIDYSGPQYEINLDDMRMLDYNNTIAAGINDLLNDDTKFSIADDGKKSPKKPLTQKQVDAELEALRQEILETGTFTSTDEAEQIEAKRLEEYAVDLDNQFNQILEKNTGVDAKTEYSEVVSKVTGAKKDRFVFFVPPAADDYRGLIENYIVGKGEDAKSQLAFFEEYLHQPYETGVDNYSAERVRMNRQFKQVKKAFAPVFKQMQDEAVTGLTVEHAVRIYIWTRLGEEIPGISKEDQKAAHSYVVRNPLARDLAIEVMKITDLHGYASPKKHWTSGGLLTDIFDSLRENSRKKYLQEYLQNTDIIFSEKNLNKLRSLYGNNYHAALVNMLERMRTGRNRTGISTTKQGRAMLDWLNGAVGVTMFVNNRSAVLQLISFSNYIDLEVNPIHRAAARYADYKQFFADVVKLINSDYMIERRNGLKIDINESELIESSKNSDNKFAAAISKILSKGFLPTRIADSLAIVFGGAPYYRNSVIRYMKEGLTQQEAETQAFIDFRRKTEESQQSSAPERISKQQADPAGRLMLTYANTQSQYARIIKKEATNLKKGRGNPVNSVARIAYYGMLQNALFISMQTAMIASLLGDDEPKEEETTLKNRDDFKLINGTLDSFLRGAGIAGHLLSVIKNTGVSAYDRLGRPNPDFAMLLKDAAQVMPALGSKVSRFYSAGYYFDKAVQENKKDKKDLATEYFFRGVASTASLTVNFPADRILQKFENVKNSIDFEKDFETYQRVLMFLGWPDYQLGIDDKDISANMQYYIGADGKVYARPKKRSKSKKVKRNRKVIR